MKMKNLSKIMKLNYWLILISVIVMLFNPVMVSASSLREKYPNYRTTEIKFLKTSPGMSPFLN